MSIGRTTSSCSSSWPRSPTRGGLRRSGALSHSRIQSVPAASPNLWCTQGCPDGSSARCGGAAGSATTCSSWQTDTTRLLQSFLLTRRMRSPTVARHCVKSRRPWPTYSPGSSVPLLDALADDLLEPRLDLLVAGPVERAGRRPPPKPAVQIGGRAVDRRGTLRAGVRVGDDDVRLVMRCAFRVCPGEASQPKQP